MYNIHNTYTYRYLSYRNNETLVGGFSGGGGGWVWFVIGLLWYHYFWVDILRKEYYILDILDKRNI